VKNAGLKRPAINEEAVLKIMAKKKRKEKMKANFPHTTCASNRKINQFIIILVNLTRITTDL
jgi:hypothetical protein